MDLKAIKHQLTGPRLAQTLAAAGANKLQLARATGIAYSTLFFWQREAVQPSDETALKAAQYLGLLGSRDTRIAQLQKRMRTLRQQIDKLEEASAAK